MTASCTTPTLATATPSCLVHRGQKHADVKPFSAESREFVPKSVKAKSFSAESCEFVPQTSVKPFSAESYEFVPSWRRQEFVPKAFTAESREFVPSWKRVEEVLELSSHPASTVNPREQTGESLHPTQNDAGVDAKPLASKRDVLATTEMDAQVWPTLMAAPVPKKLDDLTLPSGASITSNTPSTRAGSPSAEFLADDAWSTTSGSSNSRSNSRSNSPAPSSPEVLVESKALPLSVHSLLMWRQAPSIQGPDVRLPFAAEPEPGSPEAAAAAAAAEAANAPIPSAVIESPDDSAASLLQGIGDTAAWSLQELMQWRHVAPSPSLDAQLLFAAEPEPDTPEAAAAIAAKAAAAPIQSVVLLSDSLGAPEQPMKNETASLRLAQEAPAVRVTPVPQEDGCWRDVSAAKKIEVSEVSWVAQQRARRKTHNGNNADGMSDADVVRAVKSILNKLTLEKFDSLSAQLLHCGISTASHLEMLIQELFEKATTQHHFIDMYADLCDLLNQQRIIENSKVNFKKVLLTCCQASFEKNLTPPSGLSSLNSEDRTTAELMYKMRMLGNIRFVGALFVRKMLASKVMLSIMEELLQDPTPEALESLAAFLMVVGPTFDTPDWAYHATLRAVFVQVEKFAKKTKIASRIRCLLKDVLDVRNMGWRDRRPKKIEGPLKLSQVAGKAAVENGGGTWDPATAKNGGNGDDWEVVGGARGKLPSPLNRPVASCSPVSGTGKQQGSSFFPQEAKKTTKSTGTAEGSRLFMKARSKEEESKKKEVRKEAKANKAADFDKEAGRAEISATLAELRVSHDVLDAVARIADIKVPVAHQPSELCHVLGHLAEEGSPEARKVGFALVVTLFLESHWKSESLVAGIRTFVEDTCADLKFDVPNLPEILREELHPALCPLVKANLMSVGEQDSLISV